MELGLPLLSWIALGLAGNPSSTTNSYCLVSIRQWELVAEPGLPLGSCIACGIFSFNSGSNPETHISVWNY